MRSESQKHVCPFILSGIKALSSVSSSVYDLPIFHLVHIQRFIVIHNMMIFPNATNDDPLTHYNAPRLFDSSLPAAAHGDFSLFRDLLHSTHVTYNGFVTHHDSVPSFSGIRRIYYDTWIQGKAKTLSESQKINDTMVDLYNRWGAEGTPRLWDTLEGLSDWWDAVYFKVDGWIKKIKPLSRPVLADWQEVEEKPKAPAPQVAQWLLHEKKAEAEAEAAKQAQLAKAASHGTEQSTLENEQTPWRRFDNRAHAGMRE